MAAASRSPNFDETSQTYAARMVYLRDVEDDQTLGMTSTEPTIGTLKPPPLFMSRRQARVNAALGAVGLCRPCERLTVVPATHARTVP